MSNNQTNNTSADRDAGKKIEKLTRSVLNAGGLPGWAERQAERLANQRSFITRNRRGMRTAFNALMKQFTDADYPQSLAAQACFDICDMARLKINAQS